MNPASLCLFPVSCFPLQEVVNGHLPHDERADSCMNVQELLPPGFVHQDLLPVPAPALPDRPERIHFVHQTRPPVLVQSPAAAGRSEESRLGSHHSGNHHSGIDRCRNRDLVVHQNHLLRLQIPLGSVRNRPFEIHSDSDLEVLLGRVRRKAGILSLVQQDSEVLVLGGLLLQEPVLVLAEGPLLVRGLEVLAVLAVLAVLEEGQQDLILLGQLWAQ